ncbi:MAG: hypothetical protein ACR2MO_13035 [Acidimicrobiales bacterium]
MLVTNDVASADCAPELLNTDIGLGLWRVLDVTRPPFDFPSVWSTDDDVAGRWTKRMHLAVRPSHRPVARARRQSALRLVSGLEAPGSPGRSVTGHWCTIPSVCCTSELFMDRPPGPVTGAPSLRDGAQ